MAPASDTRTRAHLQPAHLPPAGRSLTSGQHRRGMLASLAGIAAAGAVAAPAQATAPDPVLALVDRAERFQRQGDALAAVGDERGAGQFWHLRWLADDEVLATRPTTMAGLAQQIRILGDRLHGGSRFPEDGDEAHRLADFAEALNGRAVA